MVQFVRCRCRPPVMVQLVRRRCRPFVRRRRPVHIRNRRANNNGRKTVEDRSCTETQMSFSTSSGGTSPASDPRSPSNTVATVLRCSTKDPLATTQAAAPRPSPPRPRVPRPPAPEPEITSIASSSGGGSWLPSPPRSTSIASSSGEGQEQPRMDKRLLKAATSGDSMLMNEMASQDPDVLLGTTPAGNTCLHISATHGHEGFCMDVVALQESLLSVENLDGEAPLLAVVRSGCVSLASVLLRCYRERRLSEAILKQDIDGCNVLHHAIRSGHMDLALELIEAEPTLSTHVNRMNESPMFIAAMRNFTDISEKLLEIPDSAHGGPLGFNASTHVNKLNESPIFPVAMRYVTYEAFLGVPDFTHTGSSSNNALHAAARNGNSDLAKRIVETHPHLARETDMKGRTPLGAALYRNQIGVVRVLLEHDCSLGYHVPSNGRPVLSYAAFGGHINVAQELLNHCPDTPYHETQGPYSWTALHIAVCYDQVKFTEFIVKTPQLRKLINIRDAFGKTALHYAVWSCNPKMVAALLSHKDIDTIVLDNQGMAPAWELSFMDHAKTLNWNEVNMLMQRADPRHATSLDNLHTHTKHKATRHQGRMQNH